MDLDRTILVNRTHPVPEDFSDRIKLVIIPMDEENCILVEEETAKAYQALQQHLIDSGVPNSPLSGYRSFERQQVVWDNFIRDHGPEYAARYVAKPGFSEHQTGLAIDVTLYDQNGNDIEDSCAPEFETMHRILHPFGFILRYPAGREAITGYDYEPWHIRYVGIQAAEMIYRSQWTLEEYWEQKSQP